MYKTGTGDFFLLRVTGSKPGIVNIMIDCGSFSFRKDMLEDSLAEIKALTGGKIDLLIVSHEHKDHIYGFQKGSELFSKFKFLNVWFAWTENEHDAFANQLRKKAAGIKLAINQASVQLKSLTDKGYFKEQTSTETNSALMLKNTGYFMDSLNWLNDISAFGAKAGSMQTMADKFREWNIIGKDTKVEFMEPGQVIETFPGMEDFRFMILGPPKDLKALNDEGHAGDYYQKREKPSAFNFELIDALRDDANETRLSYPFRKKYIETDDKDSRSRYSAEKWKTIDSEWLMNAGNLALKFERCLNNTSLVVALQLKQNEHVLLFPGDAEFGNWNSWFNGLTWKIESGGKTKTVDAKYILRNTVFYKTGHHLSQNGTPKAEGIDLMTHKNLQSAIPLDLDNISATWKNTMPNDYLGATLIEKTSGKTFISGTRDKVIRNIRTARVKVDKTKLDQLEKLNKAFDTRKYLEVVVD